MLSIRHLGSVRRTVLAGHLRNDMSAFLTTDMHAFFDYMEAVGCYSPGLSMAYYRYNDLDSLKHQTELYNKIGKECQKRGMVFHYHNHWHEYQRFGDKYVMDLLMAYTDPDLVKLELDTYWCMRGGADPLQQIHKHGNRIIMLHQKDFSANYKEPVSLFEKKFDMHQPIDDQNFRNCLEPLSFCEVGSGVMDIQAIIDAALQYGVKYITLEQDCTEIDEMESIAKSMEAFRTYHHLELN